MTPTPDKSTSVQDENGAILTALDIAKAALHALANPHYEWDEPRAEAMRQFANERIGKMLDAPDDDMRIAALEAALSKIHAIIKANINNNDEHYEALIAIWRIEREVGEQAAQIARAALKAAPDKEDSVR